MTDWDDYTGRFVAAQDAEITARVNGVITQIHFRDGQDVRQGQPLFTIDPRPYRAALAQAEAQIARAQAALTNARQVTERSRQLASAQAVSAEELENNVAAERAATADLAAGRAAASAAQLNLGFTTVRAPFSGRVSDRRVSLGDAVAQGTTVLTRVVSLNPIRFEFEGAESFYLKNLRQDERGERGSSRTTANPVQIQLADETEYRWNGRMEFLDNAVDPNSGTIRAHAVVSNPTRFLTPGMFGRARLLGSGTYRAMLVPDEAIVTDQTRRLVYVVSKDNKATPRVVEVGAKAEGLRIIRDGLAPTDRVIITGLGRLQPGAPVNPKKGVIKPDTSKQAAPTRPIEEPASGQATVR
ncbi:efflux transporter periplasmic adaptor subunit [Sphingomonas turrisvirgatae]|uniref:Efflux transporter periplasmic adaptor subunit n=1 Tax=Sphingomonas turrisvirgatae TaxID=1888892 RepID=A0A1E3LY22_9SPHN|nr:efflux transporter periplasmic adaptor subunit [Sphingomonas turrisvirgatae]